MKVIIAGGGTGGHLYPGIAVAEKLRARGVEVLFLVSDRGIEKAVLEPLGYKYVEQDITAFVGMNLFKKVASIKKLVMATNVASQHIDKKDKVLLMGGFASAPSAFAAFTTGVDLHIHEQNSVMGLVNKIMATQSRRVYTSYKHTRGAPKRSMYTGNPVRKEFMDCSLKANVGKNLLILGGSGGSRAINNIFARLSEQLIKDKYTVHHQTGMKMYEETLAEYEKYVDSKHERLNIVPYIDKIWEAYEEADLVIARAGSGTVFETTYSRRPAIYIPFAKSANNHQYHNAEAMVEKRYARLIEEKNLNENSLLTEIEDIFNNMDEFRTYLAQVEPVDSAELIANGLTGY